MINIIAAFKEFLTVKKAVATIPLKPKSGYLTTEWLGMFLAGLSSIYMGAHALIPPMISIYIGVGLAVLWLIFRQVLKWKHLSLSAVNGIPDLDEDFLISLLTTKFPKLAGIAPDLKTIIAEVEADIKKEPEVVIPAPAGSTTTVSVTPPATPPEAPPVNG